MQVATLPGYQHLVGAKGHERQALRRRRGEGVGCLQCCEEREDSSRRHRLGSECSPNARVQRRPQRWVELAAALKYVSREAYAAEYLGLARGLYAVVTRARRLLVSYTLAQASLATFPRVAKVVLIGDHGALDRRQNNRDHFITRTVPARAAGLGKKNSGGAETRRCQGLSVPHNSCFEKPRVDAGGQNEGADPSRKRCGRKYPPNRRIASLLVKNRFGGIETAALSGEELTLRWAHTSARRKRSPRALSGCDAISEAAIRNWDA